MTEQNQTKQLDEWTEVEDSNFWNPTKEGDEIMGVIVSKQNDDYGVKVIIEVNEKKVTLPSHKVLQSRLIDTKVGDVIKVVYVKEELPKVKGRNPTKIYKVYIRKEAEQRK